MSEPNVQKNLSPRLMDKLRRVPEAEIESFLREKHPELFKAKEKKAEKNFNDFLAGIKPIKPKRDIDEVVREIRDQDFGCFD